MKDYDAKDLVCECGHVRPNHYFDRDGNEPCRASSCECEEYKGDPLGEMIEADTKRAQAYMKPFDDLFKKMFGV